MYFNNENNNSNTEKESILDKLRNGSKKLIIVIVALIVLIILIVLLLSLFKNKITFKLLGDTNMKMSMGETYVEPGYLATDKNGVDISGEVLVMGDVDSTQEGNYTITYALRGKKLQRSIEVVNDKAIITLTGDNPIYIRLNGEYVEPGFTCNDKVDGDLTDKVVVTNDIDTSKMGTYKVFYEVTNSRGEFTKISRIVMVK